MDVAIRESGYHGYVLCTSTPLSGVEEGMLFEFNGSSLSVFWRAPLDDDKLATIAFDHINARGEKIDALVECRFVPSNERATFHVMGTNGVGKIGLNFRVVDYWVCMDDMGLADASQIAFAGPSIDSFCPVSSLIDGESSSIRILAPTETRIDGGEALVATKKVNLAFENNWTRDGARGILFRSILLVDVRDIDCEFLKSLYISISSALRFCLGRGNVDLSVDLIGGSVSSTRPFGRFVACHGKTFIPDEFDDQESSFIRASDIGTDFAKIVSAFSTVEFPHSSFDLNRADSNLITYAKIVEVAAYFEKEFALVFPDGVVHSDKSAQSTALAVEAIKHAAESLPSDAKRKAKTAAEHIGGDNLQSRMYFALRELDGAVVRACSRGLGDCKRGDFGKCLTDARNAIAHGRASTIIIREVSKEYQLVKRLVLAMRLVRMGFDSEKTAFLISIVR